MKAVRLTYLARLATCITKAFLDFLISLEMFNCLNLLQAPLSIQEGVGIGASYKSCKKSMVVGKVSEDRKQAIVEHIWGMKDTACPPIIYHCKMQRHDRGTGYYIQWFCPKPFRCHITDLPGIPTSAGKEFILPHAHSITSYLRPTYILAHNRLWEIFFLLPRPRRPRASSPTHHHTHASPHPPTTATAARSTNPTTTSTEEAASRDAAASYISSSHLRNHGTRHADWISIDGAVYDVTEWLHRHPGGSLPVFTLAGRNATDAFQPPRRPSCSRGSRRTSASATPPSPPRPRTTRHCCPSSPALGCSSARATPRWRSSPSSWRSWSSRWRASSSPTAPPYW
ncbi:hypothetical protein Fmac_025431 [Flemingia macrophylla]|uniref:Cytochrome b5 heme-binding domain-containing protein n=1 Tax=Flemingia macrophylla TaxID=520843 RepID=A0ABD1LSS9_9FABA